jgi:CheY-like chemotaxis protein
MDAGMQRVFVKVIGFSEVERHALNTLFRLSQDRETSYAPWQPELGVPADIALADADSYEARLEAASPAGARLHIAWIGPDAPEGVWRSFPRPVQWAAVIAALDELFRPALPLDFDFSTPASEGPAAPAGPAVRRALIASADRDERLYLRARLALAQLTQADEAETAADLLELVRHHRYALAFVDFSLAPQDGWELVRLVRAAEPKIPCLVVIKDRFTPGDRVKARLAGIRLLLTRPAGPEQLKALLDSL